MHSQADQEDGSILQLSDINESGTEEDEYETADDMGSMEEEDYDEDEYDEEEEELNNENFSFENEQSLPHESTTTQGVSDLRLNVSYNLSNEKDLESKSSTSIEDTVTSAFNEDAVLHSYRIGSELFIHDADRQLFLECETIYHRYMYCVFHLISFTCRMILQKLEKKIKNYNPSGKEMNDVQEDSKESLNESMIAVLTCAQCSQILGKEDSIFQVPGAAGTIGAYVNPHG